MDRDRNLLFGVMAVQLRRITAAQLMQVAGAWATDPSRDLARRLVEAGALSAKDRNLLDRLVDEAVAAHEGDAAASLADFGGDDEVRRSFCGVIERTASGEVCVSSVPTMPPSSVGDTQVSELPEVEETPGRYTMSSEQGRGGIGRVLLVHDHCLGRDVALKELLAGLATDTTDADSPVRRSGQILSRFLQEARVTGQLEHPSIVPVYELGRRRDGTTYYTMKLVRGRSLGQALEEADTLPMRLELLPHFADLCQAVAYAHSRNVIHRDLKPANVMVGEFGETVVIDWGLAKVKGIEDIHASEMARAFRKVEGGSGAAVDRTAYGVALGTPAYMPPEQAKGAVDLVDERSDIYSLGAVLYEILTGSAPFEGRSVAEVLAKVKRARPRPILELAPDTPPEMVAICERATASEPARRYQTAKELADDVRRFLSGALVQAYQYRFPEHLRRFVKRHRAAVATAAVFAVVLATVLAGAAWWNLRERRRAEREAETATQVSEFLQGIFSVSDPGESRGNRITARELLDRGAERVDQELADQPLVQARMMSTMGMAYHALGLYNQAMPLLEEALRLRRSLLADEAPDVAESLNNLASVLFAKGDHEGAEALIREAVAVQRRLAGDGHAELAVSLNNLASLLQAKGDYDGAEPLHREALVMWRRLVGDEHRNVAASINNVGFLLYEKGDYDAAEPLYREALAMRRRLLGGDHPDVAVSLNNLAALLHRRGDHEGAEPLYRETLAMRRRLLSGDHPDVALGLNNLAVLLHDKGDYDGAEAPYREALAMWRRLLGAEHPDVAMSLNNLAGLLRDRGDYDGAEALYREALAMQRRVWGDEHPAVAVGLNNLAALLLEQGNHDAAEPLYREALAMRRRVWGAEHRDVAQSLNNLAGLRRAKGDHDGAEALLREALAMWRRLLGDEHPEVATTVNNLGSSLQAQGDYDAAEPLFREALAMRRRLLGGEHRDVAQSLHNLARLLQAKGDLDSAEPLFREAVAIQDRALPPGHRDRQETAAGYAALLRTMGRDLEAAELEGKGLE